MAAVQHWEQTDLLGLCSTTPPPAANPTRATQSRATASGSATTPDAAATPDSAPPLNPAQAPNAANPLNATATLHSDNPLHAATPLNSTTLHSAATLDPATSASPAAFADTVATVSPSAPASPSAAASPAGFADTVAPASPAPEAPTGRERAGSDGRQAPPVSLPGFTKTTPRAAPLVLERLLILDTETTALHPDDGECIEVGAVLFHVSTRSVLTQVSFLLPCRVNGAEAINGIPAAVSQLAQPWREALSCFLAMVAAADAILAHNAAFDRQWFGRGGALPALDKPWICSMDDITWPRERHLRAAPSVRDLAIAHGVPVWAAHRALTDCTYLVQVLERCGDLEDLLRLACEPRRLYQAQLSYSERQQAKEAGFRWNDPVPGAWTKRLSEREAAALPFPVHPVASD